MPKDVPQREGRFRQLVPRQQEAEFADRRTPVTSERKADEYRVGEELWEEDYLAGVIVAKEDCPERPTRVYMLLRDGDARYTIYACLKDAMCRPSLARMIPEQVVRRFFEFVFLGVDPTNKPPKKRIPVRKKSR